jgi:membrane-associated phospholipid phosphatase
MVRLTGAEGVKGSGSPEVLYAVLYRQPGREPLGESCDGWLAPRIPAVPRPIAYLGSRLPRGWSDLLLQLALFFGVYQGYQVVRGLSEGRDALAFANAERIIDLERAVGLYFEPALQSLMLNFQWVIEGANWMYVNSHFIITTSFLAWLYLFRNEHFYFVRNMFMVAMLLALTGYLLVPTAPPRLFAESGMIDTIAIHSGISTDSNAVSLLVNKYAAVPSMHIGFASMIAVPAILLVRSRSLKIAWAIYPFLVLFVVMVTGNHYWFDGAVGALVAATSALIAHRLLAPVRPGQWAFRPATA